MALHSQKYSIENSNFSENSKSHLEILRPFVVRKPEVEKILWEVRNDPILWYVPSPILLFGPHDRLRIWNLCELTIKFNIASGHKIVSDWKARVKKPSWLSPFTKVGEKFLERIRVSTNNRGEKWFRAFSQSYDMSAAARSATQPAL